MSGLQYPGGRDHAAAERSLVRDTYRATDNAGELLGLRDAAGHPASSEDITGYLLDRVLPAAYTRQPGEPPPGYDLVDAERALRRIATRMNKDGTRDLQWWHVPNWAPAPPRIIATWLGVTLVAGLAWGLAWGLAAGLAGGLTGGIVPGLAFGRGNKVPKRIAPVQWRQLSHGGPLVVGLLAGIVTVFADWGFSAPTGPATWLQDGFIGGLVAWLAAGLITGVSRPGTDNTSPLNPASSWRSDRAYGLVVGLVVWLWVGLASALSYAIVTQMNGVAAGLVTGLVTGLLGGLVIGLLVGLVYPRSWSSSLAFAQLAASDRTPVRLMRFLEDARSRSVLRTVGPVYQFRHARLQDRLAAWEPAAGQGPDEPRPAAGDAAPPAAEAPPVSTR